MYAMHTYPCFNICFGRIKKLGGLKKVMQEGMTQHDVDYNLDQLIIDFKSRKLEKRKKSIENTLGEEI